MTRRLPPLNALRAFEAAARRGGFAKAAGELAVTPAAISQQVRLLEAELGVELFRRLPRGLELTPAGRSALPELRAAFARLAHPGLHARLLLTEEVFPVCAPALAHGGPRPLRRPADLRGHTLLHERASAEPSLSWSGWLREAGVEDVDPARGPGFTDAAMLVEA